MSGISNDHALRDALSSLPPQRQRVVGARFVKSVIRLCQDERVKRAVEVGLSPSADDIELRDAYQAAKSRAVKTYTDCGKDTNWLEQADHFVAAAAAAALTPDDLSQATVDYAWKAAMQARMAESCELMERAEGADVAEAQRQYAIVEAYLQEA